MRKMLLKQLLALSMIFLIIAIAPFNTSAVAKGAGNDQPFQLNVNTKSLIKDATFSLKVYNLAESHKLGFKSSASSIASVDKDGVITANKVGDATITVTIKEGFKTVDTLQCDITVGPPAISVKLTRSEITLTVDKKHSLKTILKPNNTVEEPKFVSSDSTIASVNSNGRVVARSAGKAVITASIGDNKSDFCVIIVEEEKTADGQ